jgi:hypothetical protein
MNAQLSKAANDKPNTARDIDRRVNHPTKPPKISAEPVVR